MEKHGSDSVLVASLTRTAAAEVAGRDLPIERERIGTLHAHALHALERPTVANDPKQIRDWNSYVTNIGRGHWALTGVDRDDFGGAETEATDGDELLAANETYRARMTPRELWRGDVELFTEFWENWKERNFLKDFTDLIEICLQDVEVAPGKPRFLFLDEAQDFSRVELTLARKWARHCEKLIITGDPDQCLYSWRGTSPRNFLEPELPENCYRELDQSFRLPRATHRLALEWIRQITKRRDVSYHPRDAEGTVEELEATYKEPADVFNDAEKHLVAGKKIMILATAGYMLRPFVAFFREEGIPFYNPYTEKRGDWNPLARRRGTSVAQRIRAFLYCQWLKDPKELRLWLEMLKLDHYRRHKGFTSGAFQELRKREAITPADVEAILHDDALRSAIASDLEWLREGMLSRFKTASATDYAIKVAQRYGETALENEPQIVIGTVHSVKGGQADVVYLFPDLSPAADEEFMSDADAVIRVFYVGMTRARETLVLCAPLSNRSVELPRVA